MDIFAVLTANDMREIGFAIECIMDLTEKEPGLLKAPKDQVIVRLQLFQRIQDEYGDV